MGASLIDSKDKIQFKVQLTAEEIQAVQSWSVISQAC